MNNLKVHNTLKKHIDTLKKLTTESEILKHTIDVLRDENYKLKQKINANHKIVEQLNLEENRNILENNLEENDNNLEEEYVNEQLETISKNYRNNVEKFLANYNVGITKNVNVNYNNQNNNNNNNNKNNKMEVPKLLFILYKKKSL